MLPVEINAVVMCDDIRRELTGKDILIGVYSGPMVVASFPAQVSSAFWLDVKPIEVGSAELEFRISLTGKEPAELKIAIDVHQIGNFALSLPTLQIIAESEAEIILEIKDGDCWEILKTKAIIQGEIPQAIAFASASPPRP
jgi:hypothetical protein